MTPSQKPVFTGNPGMHGLFCVFAAKPTRLQTANTLTQGELHMNERNIVNDRIVREKERKHITGRSTASWWRDEKAGLAPRRLQLGDNAVGWKLSDLMAWLDSRLPAAQREVAVPTFGKRRGRKPSVAGRI